MQPSKEVSSVFPIMLFKGGPGGPQGNSRTVGRIRWELVGGGFSAKRRRLWEFIHLQEVVQLLTKARTAYSMPLGAAPLTMEVKGSQSRHLSTHSPREELGFLNF